MIEPEFDIDYLFWCSDLKMTREIRDLNSLKIKGFRAYCGRSKKDIDESFCMHCFLRGI